MGFRRCALPISPAGRRHPPEAAQPIDLTRAIKNVDSPVDARTERRDLEAAVEQQTVLPGPAPVAEQPPDQSAAEVPIEIDPLPLRQRRIAYDLTARH